MGRIFKSRLPPSSMILISHRGNIDGRVIEKENHPDYVEEALVLGYDVEIDVWYKDTILWLGHDKPEYKIDFKWIRDRENKLWLHCKNIDALLFFQSYSYKLNYFWHENDTITLTSKNYIWAYPGKQPIKDSIAVMPELFNDNVNFCKGICTDYIKNY